jgi:DNA polymerase III alpha subunit
VSYIELHTASAFSFLQGASLPEALVDRAAELGYPALALLDRDGVYGAPRFHKAARAAGIKPIIGAELTIENSDNSKFKIQNSKFPKGTQFVVSYGRFRARGLTAPLLGYMIVVKYVIITAKL